MNNENDVVAQLLSPKGKAGRNKKQWDANKATAKSDDKGSKTKNKRSRKNQ